MKTVQDYLDLGLVFAGDDMIHAVTGESSYGSASLEKCLFKYGEYPSGIKLVGSMCGMGEWNPSSFAWRNNDGVKPDYNGLIHAMFENGAIIQDFADSLNWGSSFNPIIQWRPVASMCNHTELKPRHSFVTTISIDGPKFTIKEETPKTITVNIEGRDYLIASHKPTVSPKEDKPMKPVYTAEMHAKNELPPVGSEVKVCIESAGFDVDDQDVKFEGKAVTVKAAFNNVELERIVAVENEDGNCACYIIECLRPIIKTIKVNGFDVPAPMSEAPECGSEYFVIDMLDEGLFCSTEWEGDDKDNQWLSNGIIHSTKSAAIAHAKAMLGIDPNA